MSPKRNQEQHDELIRMVQALHENIQRLDENVRVLEDQNASLVQINKELIRDNKELYEQLDKFRNSGCCGILRNLCPCIFTKSQDDSMLNNSVNSSADEHLPQNNEIPGDQNLRQR